VEGREAGEEYVCVRAEELLPGDVMARGGLVLEVVRCGGSLDRFSLRVLEPWGSVADSTWRGTLRVVRRLRHGEAPQRRGLP
jgi:hypothetical protein